VSEGVSERLSTHLLPHTSLQARDATAFACLPGSLPALFLSQAVIIPVAAISIQEY